MSRSLQVVMSVAAAVMVWMAGCAHPAPAEPVTNHAPPSNASVEPPPPTQVAQGEPAQEPHREVRLPGVTVNLAERYVEMEGVVCLREGLLELVATVPAGKEHESIVSLRTRPSNIHAGLLMLGVEPGEPGRWVYEEDRVLTVDPTGGRVRITLLWERDGGWVEEPISRFILDRGGKEHLPSDEFVFAGSRMYQPTKEGEPVGEPVYLADQTGDVVALVSFSSELLAWPKAASDSNESLFWTADPATIPALGTPIKLRAYAVEGQGAEDQRPEGQRPEAQRLRGRTSSEDETDP